jgi:hypothetical protein
MHLFGQEVVRIIRRRFLDDERHEALLHPNRFTTSVRQRRSDRARR